MVLPIQAESTLPNRTRFGFQSNIHFSIHILHRRRFQHYQFVHNWSQVNSTIYVTFKKPKSTLPVCTKLIPTQLYYHISYRHQFNFSVSTVPRARVIKYFLLVLIYLSVAIHLTSASLFHL